ncbi:MAG: hypothetical protein QN131_15025 [Armatimonadota bacterium]|nr:hypothetical protein [Armatimonadota bacterium]MDR7551226.1 hypothetical protein [Armatimonadota bacterium]
MRPTLVRTARISWLSPLAALVVTVVLPLGAATPPAPSGPARNGCVACHTDRAVLEPLVPPLPPPPAEGEG